MDDSLVVTVAGLQMFGRPGLGPFVIIKDGLKGWDDGVDMRGDSVPNPNGPGAIATMKLPDSRVVSIEGVILASSAGEQEDLGGRFSSLLMDGDLGRITVTTPIRTTYADAMLGAKTVVDPIRGTYRSAFQVQLWMPDPRKFGDIRSFSVGSSGVEVRHRGNYAASPVITIPGPVAGTYTVTGPGGELFIVTGGVPSGSVHTIDMDDGLLRVNSSISAGVGKVTRSDTFKVPSGGEQVVTLTGATGTVYVPDTYI